MSLNNDLVNGYMTNDLQSLNIVLKVKHLEFIQKSYQCHMLHFPILLNGQS